MELLVELLLASLVRHSSWDKPRLYEDDFKAIVLMVMNEAGSLDFMQQSVVINVMLNRQNMYFETDTYNTIQGSMGVAYGRELMQGFESIDHAFRWYAGFDPNSELYYGKGHPNFRSAFAFVVEFFMSDVRDFTHGALHFKHADSEYDAYLILSYYKGLSPEALQDIARAYGVRLITYNGYEPYFGAVGVTVFTNTNITPMLFGREEVAPSQ